MKEVLLDYGDSKMRVELPDTAEIVRYGETYVDPKGTGDPREAAKKALENPLGLPRLKDQAGPDKKIVIAFPDRVKGGAHALAHRKISIPLVVEELLAGGARLENITLICAMGLHRQNTLEEWYWYLGKEIVNQFYPDRLVNHDGEDPDLRDFGKDSMGNTVVCNPKVADADIVVMIGHCSGNPYGGYSGGHKMVATGITGWRSIASHHCPETMHRPDWLGCSPEGRMRQQFTAISEHLQASIGKKIFAVDAVIGQFAEVLEVHAGEISAVEKACRPMADRRTNVVVPGMKEPADVLVLGLPRNFHYGPGMGTNPPLMSLGIGVQLSRCWNAMREGAVIIAASVCDGWFNDFWFPSYRMTYEKLQKYNTISDFLHSEDSREIAMDPHYRYSYSNHYTYHPFHAMSMLSGGAVPLKRCARVIMVGAKKPEYARGLGYAPVGTFDEAMRLAERYVGKNPRVLCTPECYSGGAAPHLSLDK